MNSPRTGNKVANQFIITTEDGTYFQSYSTVIAFEDKSGKITLDKHNWDYSATTLKYLKQFIGSNYSKKEIINMIMDKTFATASLN